MPEIELDNPLDLEIAKRLCDALREITPANGYDIDFSGAEGTKANRVFRGRIFFGAADPIPMLSVLEAPIQPDQIPAPPASSYNTGDFELVVQGFVDDDKTNPLDPAYVARSAVRKRLALLRKEGYAMGRRSEGILGLGPAITDLKISRGVVRPPDEAVSAKAYFWLTLNFELAEDWAEPKKIYV